MLPLSILLAAALSLALLHSAPARADFGIAQADVTFTDAGGFPLALAGAHPNSWTTRINLNTTADGEPDGRIRSLRVRLPLGLVGALPLLPQCSHAAFDANSCPPDAEVGHIYAVVPSLGGTTEATLYSLAPSPGAAAELGFSVSGYTVFVHLTIATAPPYGVIATFVNIPFAFSAATAIIDTAGPFLLLPRACAGPLTTTFEAQSVEEPGTWVQASATTHDNAIVPNPLGLGACERLTYSPTVDFAPTTNLPAESSGLHLGFNAPDSSFGQVSGIARADTVKAVLTLPAGMGVNPAVAAGLDVCTPAELARESQESDAGGGCPAAAKLGSAEVSTPLIDQPVPGSVFVAQPDDPATARPGAENPFDSMFALYLILREPERGVFVSIPIEVSADPHTGRLTATLDQLPQLPVSRLSLDLREGPRAPLSTPSDCGTHQLSYQLIPSSGNPPLEGTTGPLADLSCTAPSFHPTLSARTTDPAAGHSSPFVLDLASASDEQNLSSLSLSLPPGLSAAFGTVPTCPEDRAEVGACPPDSKLGFARVALGTGSAPLWAPPGQDPDSAVYLAGPYKGAPYSLIVIVPAKAGPFDLGTIVTRATIAVDLESAQALVHFDPLPQILAGVPLHYRDLHLVLDRPGFVRNPTSCEPTDVTATATSTIGATQQISSRFQAAECAALAFKPQVSLRFFGPAHRGAHPSIETVLKVAKGEASVARAVITLPPTELLDNAHLRSICTGARFAADSCPAGSIYGHAKAWTPLLDRPLEGPVYLRSSSNRLPDLVASLNGQIHLDLTAHVSSVHGRLRYTFAALPDAPLSQLALTMRGGRKGLLVNTGGLCAGRLRASASLIAHNNKRRDSEPAIKTDCGKGR